ncbi:MAG TPA: OmpA family protein [Blastocatellia bacterium]|nr:OmpA family protein [Blastocatellia bacterium]
MANLGHPQSLGAFYTSYLLWAVAPEGQTEPLMELPIQTKFKVEATTSFQIFGLLITAEPHSRVELPSSVIVVENALRRDTEDGIRTSQLEYSGDPGTFHIIYLPNAPAVNADYHTPLRILGARRAVEIAQRAGAEKFAEPELREAEEALAVLERDWLRTRHPSDPSKNAEPDSRLAHEVMRRGEHARSLSVKRRVQTMFIIEHQATGNNIAQALFEADRARTEAEFAQSISGLTRIDVERMRKSERVRAMRSASEALMSRKRVESARAAAAVAESEGSVRDEANSARIQTEEATHKRDAAPERLYSSLSEIFETRREARGLIVNLSEVLFDPGRASLKSGARENLSQLAGVLSAFPGSYRVEIQGYSDSVGPGESNLILSRERAESVRDHLVQNGVKSERVIAGRGFGESIPAAGNEPAAGRQVNRRVEIMIVDRPESPVKFGHQ